MLTSKSIQTNASMQTNYEEVQTIAPRLDSMKGILLRYMIRQEKTRRKPSQPITSSECDPSFAQSIGYEHWAYNWHYPSILSLGRFRSRGTFGNTSAKDSSGNDSFFSRGAFEFRFIPRATFSHYMFYFSMRWAQSNGSLTHLSLKPVCWRLCTDKAILDTLVIISCHMLNTPCGKISDECECYGLKPLQANAISLRRFLDSGSVSATDSYLYVDRWGGEHVKTLLEVS
jgi:hypothetical protein